MGRRRLSREIALQALYLLDVSSFPTDEKTALRSIKLAKTPPISADKETMAFAKDLIAGARANREKIDSTIESAALNWRLERMALVDRNILRLAAYELMFLPQTPANAVIDEAIEITRKFSSEESTKFVNGILDNIARLAQYNAPGASGKEAF